MAFFALAPVAPAAARDHGRWRSSRDDGPSSLIPRRLLGPLRDAVRTIQNGVDQEPYPETAPETTPSRSEPRAERRTPRATENEAQADPTPPKSAAAPKPESEPEPEQASDPEPGHEFDAPAAQSAEAEPVPIDAPSPTSHRVLALLAALALAGGAIGFAHQRRRTRAAFAPTIPIEADAADRTTQRRVAPIEGLDEALVAAVAERVASQITKVRRGDPVPGVATGIEELKKRENAAEAATVPRVAASPASPFAATGRYEILEELGRGGMGVVYRARDTRLDRIVALKRLSDHLRDHPRAVALLLQEARSAARLNHPNIVTVYDVDHDDGAYFITMELMEGQPLSAVLQQRGKLTAQAAAWVGQHTANGLAYAHERRIVHRDVKTANLFVTRERALKIMDFGLAKMVEEVRKRASLIAGTPSYMAPEQAQGIEVDGRADLYALGVTLFELSTGSLPFEDGDPVHHHRNTAPPDPRERDASIPNAFAELVLRMMAKEPDGRPGSASEVAAQLRAIERDRAA